MQRMRFVALVALLLVGWAIPSQAHAQQLWEQCAGKVVVGILPDKSEAPIIAINCDDGGSKNTTEVVEAFASHDASVTMFLVGTYTTQADVSAITSAGDEVASHSWTHVPLTQFGSSQVVAWLTQNDAYLASLDGSRTPTFFRAPYNDTNTRVNALISSDHLVNCGEWIRTRDYAGASVDEIVNVILSAPSGSIVLMHVGYPNAVAALKIALPILKQRGERVVTDSELFQHGRPVTSITKVTRKLRIAHRWVKRSYWKYATV